MATRTNIIALALISPWLVKWIKNLSQSIMFCRVHLPFAISQISCSNSGCWSTALEMAFSYRGVPVAFDRGTLLHKVLLLVFQWQVPVVEWLNQPLRRIHLLMNASHPLSGSLDYSLRPCWFDSLKKIDHDFSFWLPMPLAMLRANCN